MNLTPYQKEQLKVQNSIDQIFDRGCNACEGHLETFVKAIKKGFIDKDQLKEDLLKRSAEGKSVSGYYDNAVYIERMFKTIEEELSSPLREAPLKINDKDPLKKGISKARLALGE